MKRIRHIYLRLLLVAIPIMAALAPAMAQVTVSVGGTSQLSVQAISGDSYKWEIYNTVTGLNLAVIPGNCPLSEAFFVDGIDTGQTVNITWLTPGTYFFKVTATHEGCSNNLKLGKVIVVESMPTATIVQPSAICKGDSTILNIVLTGTAPWSIDISAGTSTITYNNIIDSPFTLTVTPSTTTNYTVTRVTDANGENLNPSNMVTVVVKPRPITSPIIQYGP
jgi:hypothetical protein